MFKRPTIAYETVLYPFGRFPEYISNDPLERYFGDYTKFAKTLPATNYSWSGFIKYHLELLPARAV